MSRRPRRIVPKHLLIATLVVAGAASTAAALKTSTTFDEIVLVSAGARALETGDWGLVVDQPPLMPALYGLPVRLSGPVYPAEAGESPWSYDRRWEYARELYFRSGNDPEKLALLPRLVGVALLLVLGVVTYLYGSWVEGPRAGLVAAFLVLLLPDAVAHGAVAYNDLPLALAYLLALWALDVAVRRPTVKSGAVAGAVVAVAVGIKFSAVALGGVALVLLLSEVTSGGQARTASWRLGLLLASVAALALGYAVLVGLYRGDALLLGLERGLRFQLEHAATGHPAPAYLFGSTSETGWWFYFPVAFFVKTPGALHVMLPAAAAGLALGWRRRRPGMGALRSRLRGPIVGFAVFAAFLLASSLNVGFRYALPALPPLLLLVAVGMGRLWSASGFRRRTAIALLLVLYGGSTLSAAPWFLSYRSEWFRARPAGDEALLDSSYDWGQGLLALREWMLDEEVERVRLGYFGSALPGGYGISYEAAPSFLPLPPRGPESADAGRPEYTVVSATNLHGLYLADDPWGHLRDVEPVTVLGGSLYVYPN